MRKFLAIVVCKLGRFVGKLIGKGSSMPGKFALKICPDILKRVQLPPHIIAVTGSNGKTSTVEMIATVLRSQGKNVIYNAEGSNQVEGVTTLILTHATLGGKVNADVLLLESDERYAAHSFKYFHPTEFVITNLYRDQLTRNGHPESVFDAILPAIHPDTELILNGDEGPCGPEGYHKGSVFASQLTGPILVKNPALLKVMVQAIYRHRGETCLEIPVDSYMAQGWAITAEELKARCTK